MTPLRRTLESEFASCRQQGHWGLLQQNLRFLTGMLTQVVLCNGHKMVVVQQQDFITCSETACCCRVEV